LKHYVRLAPSRRTNVGFGSQTNHCVALFALFGFVSASASDNLNPVPLSKEWK